MRNRKLCYSYTINNAPENEMSIIKTTTSKSVVFTFDGFSEGYGAYVQGAFIGKYIVPKEYANLVTEGNEGEALADMHQMRKYGITLRNAGRVQ